MTSCILKKSDKYKFTDFKIISNTSQDNLTVTITGHSLKILNPPDTCKDGIFTSNSAKVLYGNDSEFLGFNSQAGVPEIHLKKLPVDDGAQALALTVLLFSVLMIPVCGIYFFQREKKVSKRRQISLKESKDSLRSSITFNSNSNESSYTQASSRSSCDLTTGIIIGAVINDISQDNSSCYSSYDSSDCSYSSSDSFSSD